MSNETKALSISFRSDDGCIEHNNRDFFTDNVDKSRTPNNITYVKRDLKELYHELFDEALAEYNARQNRPDRQILDYYEHIRKSKKENTARGIFTLLCLSVTKKLMHTTIASISANPPIICDISAAMFIINVPRCI
mgnify:CR=1 FL=1